MLVGLPWLLLLVRWSRAVCHLQPCLSLCCPPGEVRGPGDVPHPKHRCQENKGIPIPDYYPACRPSQQSSLVSAATETFLQARPSLSQDNLGGELFSCPRASDILVPARHVFGPHGLELQRNGSHRVTASSGELLLETSGLCLAIEDRNNNNHISAELYYCNPEDTLSEKVAIDIIYIICIFLSCIFFLITFLVYLLLAQLRENFFGKLMMAFLLNVCLNFLLNGTKRCLDFVYGEQILLTPICYFLGYSIHHTFISFFIWMNVMALNFTYKFSNVMRRPSSSIDHTKRNIILTCLYGQGVPAMITLILALLDTYGDCSETAVRLPNIALHDCFPSSGLYHGESSLPFHRTSQFLYFYLVIIIIIIINTACFLITGFHLTRHSFNLASFNAKQIEILNHIRLVVNISVVMGVPWCLEIISASLKSGGLDQIISQRIELCLDIVNILAGLLMFVILICKKNVIDGLKVLWSSNLTSNNLEMSSNLTNNNLEMSLR